MDQLELSLTDETGLPGDLTEDQRLVANALQDRVGRKKATPIPTLADKCGLPERDTRRVLKELVEMRGMLIGTCNKGAFIPKDKAETRAVAWMYLKPAYSLLKRAKRLLKNRELDRIVALLELELELDLQTGEDETE